MAVSYILIGLISGFVMGFWFRHQFDYLKLKDDSILLRRMIEKSETEDTHSRKAEIPVRSDRQTNFLRQYKDSGMNKNV